MAIYTQKLQRGLASIAAPYISFCKAHNIPIDLLGKKVVKVVQDPFYTIAFCAACATYFHPVWFGLGVVSTFHLQGVYNKHLGEHAPLLLHKLKELSTKTSVWEWTQKQLSSSRAEMKVAVVVLAVFATQYTGVGCFLGGTLGNHLFVILNREQRGLLGQLQNGIEHVVDTIAATIEIDETD